MLKMLYVYVIRAIGGRVVAVKLHSRPPPLSERGEAWEGKLMVTVKVWIIIANKISFVFFYLR